MGLDLEFLAPANRFVVAELSDERTDVFNHSYHVAGSRALSRFVEGTTDHVLWELDEDDLQAVADDLAALEWDPAYADEYDLIEDRGDFEYFVTLVEAYAAAGGRVRGSV